MRPQETQTAVDAYWTEAKKFVADMTKDPRNPPWYVLSLDSRDELWAWASYFQRRFGQQPFGMKMLADRKVSRFLVPCQWPEWFDPNYQRPAELAKWPPPEPSYFVSVESRIRVQRMLDSRPKPQPFNEPVAKTWKPPSDEELRAYYGTRPTQQDIVSRETPEAAE